MCGGHLSHTHSRGKNRQERLQRLERENAKLKRAAASSAGADVLQEHLKLAQEQLMEVSTEVLYHSCCSMH